MKITPYDPSFASQVADIYYKSIHILCAADYTPEELNVWAPPPIDNQAWQKRLDRKKPWLATEGQLLLGFGELDDDGHIDCFYVHPDHARRGVGRAIMSHIESLALERKLPRLYAEVSITAKPFFLRCGFTSVRPNLANTKGMALKNYIMEKKLQIDTAGGLHPR